METMPGVIMLHSGQWISPIVGVGVGAEQIRDTFYQALFFLGNRGGDLTFIFYNDFDYMYTL